MNKILSIGLLSLGLIAVPADIFADNLLEVFQQALAYDPAYQKAAADRNSIAQNIPINRSVLLPQANAAGFSQYNHQVNRQENSFAIPGVPITLGEGTYRYNSQGYTLSLTQTVFNYAEWASLSEAKLSVKAADANYTAALLDLMSRTAQAYFNVLAAEDNLRYVEAEKKAIKEQLDQVTEEYKVGVVAITGVYQAQAAYDSIISQEIYTANNVINQRQNLQVITGKYYDKLSTLKSNVPLVLPQPADPKKWVDTALKQNWSLIAARYTADAAKEQIAVQEAGHYPVVDAYTQQVYQKTGKTPGGRIDTTNNSVGIELNLPIYQGGLVVAETKQARYNYQSSVDSMTQTLRSVYNNTEQSYNNVVSGINQVKADRQAIVSNASSLRSTIEGFKVGMQTMLDVLQAQQDLYNAESQFSNDQYAYINATIALKQAAGTLSYQDLQEINSWLSKEHTEYSALNIKVIQEQANKNLKQSVSDEKLANEIIQAGGDINKIRKDSMATP
jgi:outer membrane protein